MSRNLEQVNRASRSGFITYMAANPVYFQQQFNLVATRENILKAYKEAMKLRRLNPFFPVGRDFQRTFVARRPMAA